ncbi:STAS domain-containing protein [Actinoallomurus purpureus]|uniref:STAS domain-containing protein n=1 Tax=Actinoallomurus purpureus TaxID=478114 RepID=UPI0020935F49|nr:STAS domain-containing protein [Actinoallomurus purpureus]MCO6010105.1 STAS domain-containing protein [Actinoallomurus purpureus]
MAALELSSSRRGDRTVLHINGELDIISRAELITYLDKIIRENGGKIILDLTGLDFMDTSALSTVVSYWKRLTATEDGFLALAGAKYHTARVLWITGLAQRLPMYDDVAAALADT